MKKKKYIKVIAFLVIMTMSVLFCSKAIYEKDKTAPRPNKIDESLWNYMQKAGSDELIPIYLSITPISEVAVSDTLKEKTGLDSSLFNDDERFKKEIETEIKNTLKNTKNKDTLVKELKKNFPEFKIDYNNIFESKKEESVENVTKSIILEIRKYYQSEKNKIYSSLQSAENQKFINEYVISRNSEIEFVSKYTAGMLVKANVGDIKYYSTLSEVIVISYNDPNFVAEESLAYISSQVGFDSENGTKTSAKCKVWVETKPL